ncbi:MAG: MBL fold metallo-hydrolase [Caldilineaceae bacterium]|nr:MBL fold metallo-hydrolase [Caldilineaceae bacterium]
MPNSFPVGSIQCHIVSDGQQLIDGGSFFGLVPRVLWQRVIRPDEKNRIPAQMRCLLIQAPSGLILVDSGQGDKITAEYRTEFGMDDSNLRLEADLHRVGFSPEDVEIVLLTHLHADHCGGNTRRSDPNDPNSEVVPTFPNARYLIQRLEMAEATFPNERTRGHYYPENWEPLRRTGQLDIVDGDQELAPGVRSMTVPGHTQSMQVVKVEDEGESLLFLGDACSWAAHMERLAWVPAFDLEPMRSIEGKRNLRRLAEERNALLVFQHDSQIVTGRLRPGERGPTVEPEITEVAWPDE